jgi:predicted DNA-binding transcriptional regulator AlpA
VNDSLLPQMIDARTVANQLGISPSSLRRMVLAGDFPAGVRLGGRAVRWSSEAVTHWIRTAQAEATRPDNH